MIFKGFTLMNGTYAIHLYDKKNDKMNGYFIQFSLKDKWKYPHKEYRFNNGSWLCGWGIFYFGNILAKGDK